ncbi:DnaA ATPase domain-containing protein [Hansschlegelia plantiphila]|uniref:DnaA ATPase domain-containing protein n=1 Tax=Hansschlegelia plantiphila TaxID=374655 RepID=UPI0022F26C92|nr:DnaA/Hda family protein [Hansschlegelia plantiphila]
MVRDAPRQFPLALPYEARLGLEDYLVGAPNAAAHALVTSWPSWPDRILLLVGEEGSGKTHLAEIWLAMSHAERAVDPDSAMRAVVARRDAILLLEDVDAAVGAETALFHLLNAAREHDARLLLTARSGPTLLWPMLPDLASRLRALPVARLDAPDEGMVRAVLVKLLDDRQLRVDAEVVEFVARRCDRSLGAVRRVVAALDRESLARGRAVGKGLAADVLARLLEDED